MKRIHALILGTVALLATLGASSAPRLPTCSPSMRAGTPCLFRPYQCQQPRWTIVTFAYKDPATGVVWTRQGRVAVEAAPSAESKDGSPVPPLELRSLEVDLKRVMVWPGEVCVPHANPYPETARVVLTKSCDFPR